MLVCLNVCGAVRKRPPRLVCLNVWPTVGGHLGRISCGLVGEGWALVLNSSPHSQLALTLSQCLHM